MNGRCDGCCVSKYVRLLVPLHVRVHLLPFGVDFLAYLSPGRGEVPCYRGLPHPIQFDDHEQQQQQHAQLQTLAKHHPQKLQQNYKRVGVYYDRIELAIAYYRKKWFSTVALSTPFYQGHKNTGVLRPVFEGQQVLSLGACDLSKFEFEKSAGVYNIDVKLAVKIRVKYGKIKTARFKPRKIDCPLRYHAFSSNGTVAEDFRTTKCGNVHFFSDPDAVD